MGPVMTDLLAVAGQSAPGAADALSRVTPQPFGVYRAAGVIVLIFAFSLGSMILGGHLKASQKRKRTHKGP
jgi:hypothetical protein